MKTKAALVRTDCAVELHTVAAVNVDSAVVIDPRHTEHGCLFRGDKALQKRGFLIFRVAFHGGGNGVEHFRQRLAEFRLIAVTLGGVLQHFLHITHKTLPFATDPEMAPIEI